MEEVEKLYNGVIPYSHAQPYLRVTELPTDEPTTKRAADNALSSDLECGPEPKKAKPNAHEEREAAPPLLAGPCVESTCVNSAAARCALGACSSCCAKLSSPERPCEHHQLKAEKAKEKRAARNGAKKMKKKMQKAAATRAKESA